MTPGLGIEPGTHWWKASALTTTPTLLEPAEGLHVERYSKDVAYARNTESGRKRISFAIFQYSGEPNSSENWAQG